MSEARIRILNMLAENKIAAAEAGRLLDAIAGLEPALDAITINRRFPNAQGAMLWEARTEDAGLEGAILDGADLTGADLRGADFYGTNLTNANLRDANLTNADLNDSDWAEADLQGADLRAANLNGSNFQGARLPGANLSGAELAGADCRGLSYPGLNLAGMDLTGLKTHQPNAKETDDVSFLQPGQIPVGTHLGGGIGRYTEAERGEWPSKDSEELVMVMAGAVILGISGQLYLFKAGDVFVVRAGRSRECVAIVEEAIVAWTEH